MMGQRLGRWVTLSAVATGLYGFSNLYHPTVVLGESMAPTLHSGRLIWVDRTYYRKHAPARGEVVVFRYQGHTYVKRIYRGPGEKIAYVSGGGAWIAPVTESAAPELRERYRRSRSCLKVVEMRVPDDCVFVLGDNYLRSEDSRQLGPIPIDAILGRARLEVDTTRIWGYEIGPRHLPRRIRAQMRAAAPGA